MSLAALGWLFTLGVLAHNAEEALALPAWSAEAGRWRLPVSLEAFRFAALAQSLLLLSIAAGAWLRGPRSALAYAFAGYAFAMVVNALAPHLAGSLALRKVVPGTATAVVLNLPLGVLFLRRALAEGFVVWETLVWAAPAVALLLLLSIPVLFAIGRWWSAT